MNDLTTYGDAGKPRILIGTDEAVVVREAIAALSMADNVFVRGGQLVRVVGEPKVGDLIAREQDAPRIEIMPIPWLGVVLSEVAAWGRRSRNGDSERWVWSPRRPPRFAVNGVAAAPAWPGVPQLTALVETPVLLADGSVLDTPGLHAASGLLYRPLGDAIPVPASPPPDDVARALALILEVVADFPFEAKEHKAAWLAALLTPFARWAFDGPVPLFLFDSNVRGAGKTLCAKVTGLIATGRELPSMTWPDDESERRKRLTALALAGDVMVLMDNIETPLGGASFNSALTSTKWNDRILGASKTTGSLPLYPVWLATGNNVVLGRDTPRRTIPIRFASPLERPEARSDFLHPSLLAWVADNRPRLVAAALTLLRAYFTAGTPKRPLFTLGSFEGWSDLVRQCVVWLGLPDPAESQRLPSAPTDDDSSLLRGLLAGLEEVLGLGKYASALSVIEKLRGGKKGDYRVLRATLAEHLPNMNGDIPSPQALAGLFRRFAGRVLDGKKIVSMDYRGGVKAWSVQKA